jgi:Na+/melibiose symporter-like transporter
LAVPIYFQAIKGSTPSESGLQLLPLLISAIVVGIFCGAIVTWGGYYTPFIVVGSAIFTIGAALLTLFTVQQANWRAYGFTIIAGTGYGLSLQNAYIAVQAVLPNETLPIGNAVVMFCQTFSYVPITKFG